MPRLLFETAVSLSIVVILVEFEHVLLHLNNSQVAIHRRNHLATARTFQHLNRDHKLERFVIDQQDFVFIASSTCPGACRLHPFPRIIRARFLFHICIELT